MKKSSVADVVRSIAGTRRLHWLPNVGNAGDNLIAAATSQYFERKKIAHATVADPDAFDPAGKIVCYGGGGNLVAAYRDARNFLLRSHRSADHIIVLPHTIDQNDDLLSAFGANVTLICREMRSYEHCRRVATRARVCVADDMAFAIRPFPLVGRRAKPLASADPDVQAGLLAAYNSVIADRHPEQCLSVWRGDCEAHPGRDRPARNDISALFSVPFEKGLPSMVASAQFLLRVIMRFSAVRTDRLHVAIAGALLGKRVELYAGSYYKNRAVYDFSLRRFRNVRFVDW
jgi:exopolysaccharide biosynthesis predicted pyruvyltransferase EpsI